MRLDYKKKLFLILCLTTLFDFALIIYRNIKIDFDWELLYSVQAIAQNRSTTFMFLIWNLFLAWVPYWVALAISWLNRKNASGIIIAISLAVWLVFFPNAPYIITDFLHLKHRPPIPMWYDLLLLFSFSWTGLILAYASLMEVQTVLRHYTKSWISWVFTVAALGLSGFGIYIGRFQRWNSWDILTRPEALFADIIEILSNPIAHLNTLGMAVVLSVMLVLGYFTLIILSRQNIYHEKYGH